MSPWLTFVIGVILGLLIGWIIDWWYRRRETAASLKPVETRAAPPSWMPPQVETPTAPPVAPAVEASREPLEALPDVEARTFEPPSEPVPPVEAFPPIPVELPPTVAVPVASLDAPALPAIERPAAAVEAPVVEEIHLPSVTAEVPELPEIHLPSVTAELPVSQVNLAAPVEQIDWPAVGDLPQVVTTDEVPVAPARIADELPMTVEGLPDAAVEALTPNAVEVELPAAPVRAVDARDRLIVIEGIGPVYEKKLNAAGINTFRQLADAHEDRLREIIQPQSWQRVVFAEWIEQARLIVEGKNEELKTLQAQLFSRKKG